MQLPAISYAVHHKENTQMASNTQRFIVKKVTRYQVQDSDRYYSSENHENMHDSESDAYEVARTLNDAFNLGQREGIREGKKQAEQEHKAKNDWVAVDA
jgi:hypothetical protein